MPYRKHVILFWAIALVAIGCAGRSASRQTTPQKQVAPAFDPVDIPQAIDPGARELFEKTLLMLPAAHPDRIAFRDRIIASIAAAFNARKKDDIEGRLALFDEALALHDPADFADGRVSPAAAPLARWALELFEQRGNEAIVLASLRFLMYAEPGDGALRERYRSLSEWSVSVRETIPEPIEKLSSLIDMFMEMVRRVPDREVIERLAGLYVDRHRLIASEFEKGEADLARFLSPQDLMMQGRMIKFMPVNVIYLFFRLGDPAGAKSYLEDLSFEGSVNTRFIDILDALEDKTSLGETYLELAGYLGGVDPQSELRACFLARAADRSDPRGSLCVGYALDKMGRLESASDFYVEAARVAPQEEVYSHVMQLMQEVLFKLHQDERAEAADRVMAKADKLVEVAIGGRPGAESELLGQVASLLCTLGEVEFDNGRIERAMRYLERSFSVMANLRALAKIEEVYYLQGDFARGMETLDKAKDGLGDDRESAFWRAILAEKRADLLTAAGQAGEAVAFYKTALQIWDEAELTAEQASTVAFRRGVILDRLGDMEKSMESFKLAVRIDPDRQDTYTQLISFLTIEERFDEAKQFYELAYNHDQIETMWKIYYSLWIEGLSRRTGRGSVDLAAGYLESRTGESWQDKLAGYFAGKIGDDALAKSAANSGQRVEYEYYTAVLALAAGKKAEARARLDKVIESKLLGFFEYRMARAILDRAFVSQN